MMDKWFEFDDSQVSRVDNGELKASMVTKAAYLLFYKLRK